MTFLEVFMLVASGATIFAFIVGVFSVYNGRMTRREISRQIRETTEKLAELIITEGDKTRELIRETRNLIVAEGDKTRELIKVLKG